jgi:hypothetical protein
MAFSRECKRLRRESALTIMFAATALWRSRSSLRAAQAALAIRPSPEDLEWLKDDRSTG